MTFENQDFFFNFKNNKHFYLIRPHCADGNWVKGGLLVVLEEWRGWQTWWRCGDTPRVLHMYLFLNVLPPLPSLNNTASYISTNLSLLFMPSPTCRGFTASCGVEYLQKWVFRNMDFINITIDYTRFVFFFLCNLFPFSQDVNPSSMTSILFEK